MHITLAHCLLLCADWVAISNLLPDGLNSLEASGWLYSLMARKPVDATFDPIPWYTYPAIEFIEDKVESTFTLFEFGSGYSTLWWANRVERVISVENDPGWFAQIQAQLPQNSELSLIEEAASYPQKILEYPDQFFDVIVIDGINRNECARVCPAKLKAEGFIIFDNTDHPDHHPGIHILQAQGFKQIDFFGLIPFYTYKNCTSIFFKGDSILRPKIPPYAKQSCLGLSCMQIVSPSPH